MQVPEQWRDYPCMDYFSSVLATHGYWDENSQLWLIEPSEEVKESPEVEFLQVGRPGFDSIAFGYRKQKPGFWAIHPIENRFQYLASSIQEFLDGWFAGQITI